MCWTSGFRSRSMAQTVHEEFLSWTGVAGGRGNARKDDDDEHAGVDLRNGRAERIERGPSFLIGGVAENFGTSFQLAPSASFCSRETSTIRPSSTRGRSSCTTFRMR